MSRYKYVACYLSGLFHAILPVWMANDVRPNPICRHIIVVFNNTQLILAETREYHSIAFLMIRKGEPIVS